MSDARSVVIESETLRLEATLADSAAARAFKDALPVEGKANLWGDELYFEIPLEATLEPGATDQLPAGSLAFWPPGNAFCIIWGTTPASHEDEPRFASPVNALGTIHGDWSALAQISQGETVRVDIK